MDSAKPLRRAKAAYPGKVAIRHVLEAARAFGLDVAGVEVEPNGTIRAIEARAMPKPAEEEDLFARLERDGKI